MKLISRRSAIMALTKQMSDWNDDRNKIVEQCIGAIRELKVHDSKKHKTGKWVTVGCIDICSECGASRENQFWDEYCGRCGAKMEVKDSEMV